MIEKKSMIAYCGLNCAECAVFLATQKNDDDERKQAAEKWSKKFNWNLMPSDINCEGCKVEEGRIFGFCKKCEVRTCANEKGIDNCAFCDEYACKKLQSIISLDSAIKTKLEKIRKTLL